MQVGTIMCTQSRFGDNMAWSTTPIVATGDEMLASQMEQVRQAVLERQAISGGTPPTEIVQGDTILAAQHNALTAAINAMLSTAYGTWIVEPTDDTDPAALTVAGVLGHAWTSVSAGTTIIAAHINELQSVLNAMRWLRLPIGSAEAVGHGTDLYTDPVFDTAWDAIKSVDNGLYVSPIGQATGRAHHFLFSGDDTDRYTLSVRDTYAKWTISKARADATNHGSDNCDAWKARSTAIRLPNLGTGNSGGTFYFGPDATTANYWAVGFAIPVGAKLYTPALSALGDSSAANAYIYLYSDRLTDPEPYKPDVPPVNLYRFRGWERNTVITPAADRDPRAFVKPTLTYV